WEDLLDSVPDLALLVCGCSVKCAIKSGVQGARGRIVVSSQKDFPSAVEAIERAFSNNSVEQ
ncbi:MAG: hypothetical protein LBT15_06605, partial [Synergistaceae bacterium]|nr:hypothetical protein [Synergistaceae bacterium]